MSSLNWSFRFRRNSPLPFILCFCIILNCSCEETEEKNLNHNLSDQLINEVRRNYTTKLDCYTRELEQKARAEITKISNRQIQAEWKMYFLNLEQRMTAAKILVSADSQDGNLIAKAKFDFDSLKKSDDDDGWNKVADDIKNDLFDGDEADPKNGNPQGHIALIDYLASHGLRQINELRIHPPSDKIDKPLQGQIKDGQRQLKEKFRAINRTAKRILKVLEKSTLENTLLTARSMHAAAMIASVTSDSVVYAFPILPFREIPEVKQADLVGLTETGGVYSRSKNYHNALLSDSNGRGPGQEILIFRKKLVLREGKIKLVFQYRKGMPLIMAAIPFEALDQLDKDKNKDEKYWKDVFSDLKAKPFYFSSSKEKFYRSPELVFCICPDDDSDRQLYRIRFQLTNSISESPTPYDFEHKAIYRAEYILEESSGQTENQYLWKADGNLEEPAK